MLNDLHELPGNNVRFHDSMRLRRSQPSVKHSWYRSKDPFPSPHPHLLGKATFDASSTDANAAIILTPEYRSTAMYPALH